MLESKQQFRTFSLGIVVSFEPCCELLFLSLYMHFFRAQISLPHLWITRKNYSFPQKMDRLNYSCQSSCVGCDVFYKSAFCFFWSWFGLAKRQTQFNLLTPLGAWGLLKDGEVPSMVLVAVQDGSCFNHQTNSPPADSRHCGMSLWSGKGFS